MYEDAIVLTLPDRQAVSILPFPESVLESSMSDDKIGLKCILGTNKLVLCKDSSLCAANSKEPPLQIPEYQISYFRSKQCKCLALVKK